MGHRLSKIYTRTGDAGTTGLSDGSRVAKDSARIDAIGTVDELNSQIGVILAEAELSEDVRDCLVSVQHDLFDLGGELSIPGHTIMTAAQVTRLEKTLDAWNGELAPLKEFILPGGSRAAALTHVARAVCRRAERTLATLGATESLPPQAMPYVNRLSDLLFVLARTLNQRAGRGDVMWQQGKNR